MEFNPSPIFHHFEAFFNFLQPNDHRLREHANNKLAKLTDSQFTELSTDVYDELSRRLKQDDAFLYVCAEFHPKRNQARQKLATLSGTRFKELVKDVYFETTRRCVQFSNPDHVEAMFLSQNAHTIPDLRMPQEPISRKNTTDFYNQPRGFEKTEELSKRNAELESEIIILKNKVTKFSESEAMLDALSLKYGELEMKHSILLEEEKRLQFEVEEKERIKFELQNMKESFTEEIKSLAQQNNNFHKEREENLKKIELLEYDLQKLQTKLDGMDLQNKILNQKNESLHMAQKSDKSKIDTLENTVSQLRVELHNVQSLPKTQSSKIVRSVSPDANESNLNSIPQKTETNESHNQNGNSTARLLDPPFGAETEVKLDVYQHAINDLIEAARSFKPGNVLVGMKCVVIACKNIVQFSEAREKELSINIDDLKFQLSDQLTNLMNVAKKHASKNDASTFGSIEVAAEELNLIVVSLIDAVTENKKAPANLLTPEDGYMSGNESTGAIVERVYEISELKVFLENQTDLIVQHIQSLLYSMRQKAPFGVEFQETIGEITKLVAEVNTLSFRTFEKSASSHIREEGMKILEDLAVANGKLEELGSSISIEKNAKQKLASSSYEIAKFVKALISLLEE